MPLPGHLVFGLILLLIGLASPVGAAEGCLSCHAGMPAGFNSAHSFAAENCTVCHAGDPVASDADSAHAGLLAFPGNMSNAAETCGACHADKVQSVSHSLMHTGHGMVATTRRLVDGEAGAPGSNTVQSLGHGPADSMLRKLCASCHLGQEKTVHKLDPMSDRGGGCLACHINSYPENTHPALTRNVSDGRCFGCHSRSGRISLSYTGLAEFEAGENSKPLRLADGRTVERMPEDVHYRAGMGCIDCHTAVGLMGDDSKPSHQREAVDISCGDCHIDTTQQPPTTPLVTAHKGTPLSHVEAHDDGLWLRSKTSGRKLRIPGLGEQHKGYTRGHERLECATCHSQWAPRCFGCHMSYDGQGEQWDHVEKKLTPGRWHEQRSDIDNGLAALGVNRENQIELFVPGMIMSVTHPNWEKEKFLRVFAPLSPHTSGTARSCESCHRSTEALGLGQGNIEQTPEGLRFTPHRKVLRDGLPLDAWTEPSGLRGGGSPLEGQRPLIPAEMEAILAAPLPDRSGRVQQPSSAAGGGSSLTSSVSTKTGGTNGSAASPSGNAAAPERSPTK